MLRMRCRRVTNEQNVLIDADETRMQFPEHGRLASSGRETQVAGFLYEESSMISKRAQREAVTQRRHIVLDGTSDSNRDSLAKKFNEPRAAGYEVKAEHVTAPISTGKRGPEAGSWERNIERAASGPR